MGPAAPAYRVLAEPPSAASKNASRAARTRERPGGSRPCGRRAAGASARAAGRRRRGRTSRPTASRRRRPRRAGAATVMRLTKSSSAGPASSPEVTPDGRELGGHERRERRDALEAHPVLERLGGRPVGDDGLEVLALPGGLDERVGAGREAECRRCARGRPRRASSGTRARRRRPCPNPSRRRSGRPRSCRVRGRRGGARRSRGGRAAWRARRRRCGRRRRRGRRGSSRRSRRPVPAGEVDPVAGSKRPRGSRRWAERRPARGTCASR